MKPFEPATVPLDPGISLVEASAGTGKTYSIALTVLRLLLDQDELGVDRVAGIGKILVVTFTNAATDELITRVRAMLRDAFDVFSGAVLPADENKALFELLARYGPERIHRLSHALASLDQLSIFTIHGFCKRVLEESALESGTPFDAAFIEDESLLLDSVAQDWWRRTTYEDARLAALAVHDDWSYGAFIPDLKMKRRWPGTRIEPDQRLDEAMAALDGAIAEFGREWNRSEAGQLFDGVRWMADAFLADESNRLRVLDAGTKLAAGDHASVSLIATKLAADSLLDAKTGMQKKFRDAFSAPAFVRAADELSAALRGVRRALRVSCLENVERCFEAEKRRLNMLGFDDLLRRLHDALVEEGPDGHLALAIRSRYQAALIDEFQDTDAYQFPIFKTAFAGRPLFVIGDPKQAIYGFRGADVFAYMAAANEAARQYTLGKNWRSTARMVGAVNSLFQRRPDPFLYDSIGFLPATAARDVIDPLVGDGRAAVHWWWLPAGDKNGTPAFVSKSEATRTIHTALVSEIVRLLEASTPERPILPRCIAVLVRSAYQGLAIRDALRRAGVPCIIAGLGDVLESQEMTDLEWLLRAVAAPHDGRAVRAALTTELWGMRADEIEQLAQPDHEDDWQGLVDRFSAARDSWRRHGFMRMTQELLMEHRVAERLLAHDDGERRLTNLRHAVELLHQTSVEGHLSPEGLLLWIARAKARGSRDGNRTELRLESDADAVQIVTIHKSKGLEYDIVFCPDLWETRRTPADEPVVVHLDDGTVVFDHGSTERAARARLEAAEQLAEDLRLAYVALTRARLRCYVAWGPIMNSKTRIGSEHSSLGYLLRAEHAPGLPPDVAEQCVQRMRDSIGEWKAALDALILASEGQMSVETLGAPGGPVARWRQAATPATQPVIRDPLQTNAQLRTWRITSFTSFTAGRHTDDARDVSDLGGVPSDERRASHTDPGDFLAFPAGRQAGIALHEIFERLDFGASATTVRVLVASVLARARLAESADDPRVDAAAAMVERVVAVPLPGESFALRNVSRRSTLREWSFHLPLGPVSRTSLAELFASHGGDVARRYAGALRGLEIERAYGFLTGVVDLAFEQDGKWYIADWKSNHLGYDPADYAPGELETEMFRSHYVLQYHIYVAALHRFLKVRLPGYDYDQHIGGVFYAFLRGIGSGEAGWFVDRPPRAMIDALDALMDAPVDGEAAEVHA